MPASASPQASGRALDTSSAPNGPSSSVSGTAITERIPGASMIAGRLPRRCGKRGSREVVARPERPAADDGLPGHALVERLVSASSGIGVWGSSAPDGVGPAEEADGGIDQVDPGAVGVHQPGRLVDAQLEDRRQVASRR